MEKCGPNLRDKLKSENLRLDKRRQIALEVTNGIQYLKKIGIEHCDLKLENVLVQRKQVKIIDFGLTKENRGNIAFREMGYVRKGSKFKRIGGLRKRNLNDINWRIVFKELDQLHFPKRANSLEQVAIFVRTSLSFCFLTGKLRGPFCLIQSMMDVVL